MLQLAYALTQTTWQLFAIFISVIDTLEIKTYDHFCNTIQ